MREPSEPELIRLRSIANFQLGRGLGERLFPKNIRIVTSPKTGKIRYIYLGENLLATLRPRNGLLALTLHGAERLVKCKKAAHLTIRVRNDVTSFVRKGSDVFCKHVTKVSPLLKPGDEVIVVDRSRELQAVGKTVLSGEEIASFKAGVAVKVRRGVERKKTGRTTD